MTDLGTIFCPKSTPRMAGRRRPPFRPCPIAQERNRHSGTAILCILRTGTTWCRDQRHEISAAPAPSPSVRDSALQLTSGEGARGSPLMREETRASHSCSPGLWISTKKQGARSSTGPARGQRSQPAAIFQKLRLQPGDGHRLWSTSDVPPSVCDALGL